MEGKKNATRLKERVKKKLRVNDDLLFRDRSGKPVCVASTKNSNIGNVFAPFFPSASADSADWENFSVHIIFIQLPGMCAVRLRLMNHISSPFVESLR